MLGMELEEKYFVVVSGAFDREYVVYDEYPSRKEIAKMILEKDGESARVEKRFVLKERAGK